VETDQNIRPATETERVAMDEFFLFEMAFRGSSGDNGD
jgi:hypothetical protein